MGRTRLLRALPFLCGCLFTVTSLLAQDGGGRERFRIGPAKVQSQADHPASLGIAFKLHRAEGEVPDCMEIVTVVPGSPAEQAGLQVGDLVPSVDGKAMTSVNLFMAALRGPGTVTLEVRRGGAASRVSLVLPEPDTASIEARKDALLRMKLRAGGAGLKGGAINASTNVFAIPGIVREGQSARSINTLRTVFLDPTTGSATFVGSYDPAYATGPIDYAALLGDALHSPYPAFSLDPSPAARSDRENLLHKVDADIARVQRDLAYGKDWMLRIGNLLVADPGLGLDRQRFLKRGAEAMRVTPEQARAFWNVVAEKIPAMTPEWFGVASQIFESLGAPEIGQALQAMRNPESVRDGFQRLGLGSLVDDLKQQVNAGSLPRDRASAHLQAEFWGQILSRLGVPAASWKPSVEAVKAGRMALEPFLAQATGQLSQQMTDRLMLPWLNGLVLSQAFLERFYQSPALEVVPTFQGGLAADSELARTFFAADWVLKTLAISPELADKVPGHRTYQNYEFRMASARGTYGGGSRGSIRAWLIPQAVELRHDPSGSVVSFGPSRIAIRSELTSFEGAGRSANALEQEATAAYALEVTQKYDQYAKALPDLHRLREAAKVLALVRWAQGTRQLLIAAEPAPGKALPASFHQGFWTATFQADASKFLFVLSAHGGVDFDRKQGEAWVQPQAEPGLADGALKQLVGSAALGQQAAAAALDGDLEGARELAQKSEQAMIGDLRSGFPPMLQVPEVPEPSAYAALQSQALGQSREAIAGLQQAQAKAQQATGADAEAQRQQAETERQKWQQQLRDLKELMAQGQRNPGSAAQLVVQLRPGALGSALVPVASPPAPVSSPVVAATASSEPPLEVAHLARKVPEMTPAERARILGEIGQLRGELCRTQASLRKFTTTIQQDQAQRAEWEKTTNEAYQSAIDKVKDALADELKDLSMDLPKGYLEDKLAKAPTKEDRERLQRSLRLVQHLKESYELKDFSAWASYEDYNRDEIIEGAKMVAELTGFDELIKNKLVKRWGLGRVMAFGQAAQDIVASAYDVTSEVLAWRRLSQLNRNSEAFLKAVDASAKRQKTVLEGIRERELLLGLPAGSSKGVCP